MDQLKIIKHRQYNHKYFLTEKGRTAQLKYYYKKNNIYHPKYFPEGSNISKYNKNGHLVDIRNYNNKKVAKYYYIKIKNIFHPVYNPHCLKEGKKFKRIDFI